MNNFFFKYFLILRKCALMISSGLLTSGFHWINMPYCAPKGNFHIILKLVEPHHTGSLPCGRCKLTWTSQDIGCQFYLAGKSQLGIRLNVVPVTGCFPGREVGVIFLVELDNPSILESQSTASHNALPTHAHFPKLLPCCFMSSRSPHFGSISTWNNQCYPAVEHELKTFSKIKIILKTLVGIARNHGFRAKLWSWISCTVESKIARWKHRKECPLPMCRTRNLPLTSCPCRVWFMLYFETRVRTSLLGMRILEFSGMVGYLGFRVRPDLFTGWWFSGPMKNAFFHGVSARCQWDKCVSHPTSSQFAGIPLCGVSFTE
jgi:hypothetical protein